MSPDTARTAFVLELRNAHAMERQSQELMKWQSVRLADYPEIERRIRTHMEETDEQLRRLEPPACGCRVCFASGARRAEGRGRRLWTVRRSKRLRERGKRRGPDRREKFRRRSGYRAGQQQDPRGCDHQDAGCKLAIGRQNYV